MKVSTVSDTDPDCLFCKFVTGALETDKVYEDEHVFAFRDIHPQAPTHILIIPRRHLATLNPAFADIEEVQCYLPGDLPD